MNSIQLLRLMSQIDPNTDFRLLIQELKQNLEQTKGVLSQMRMESKSRQQLQFILSRHHLEEEELRLRHLMELEKFQKSRKLLITSSQNRTCWLIRILIPVCEGDNVSSSSPAVQTNMVMMSGSASGTQTQQMQQSSGMSITTQNVNHMQTTNTGVPIMYVHDPRGVSGSVGNTATATSAVGAEQYHMVTTTTMSAGNMTIGGNPGVMGMEQQLHQHSITQQVVDNNNGAPRQVVLPNVDPS